MIKVLVLGEGSYSRRIDTVFKSARIMGTIEVIYYNEKFDLVSALNLRMLAKSKLLRDRLEEKACHSFANVFCDYQA